ncbi:3-ketoacyl-ACP reductase [Planctomycetales bacterium]|nr:3-ketoacyl-ACP reductase [Planctomycetales bacterium]
MTKVALITGGLRGIGLGISKSLSAEGFSLALCGSREPEQVQEQLLALQNLSLQNLSQRYSVSDRKIAYYRCDVGSKNDRCTLVENVRRDFGQINLLVNNAGVGAKVRDDVLAMTEENYDWLMKINLQGPFFLTQQIANLMVEQKHTDSNSYAGIVNISSISATFASTNRGEYCMSKAAVSMATQLWSVRLAEYGIPVYEIRPGLIQSDMTAGVTAKYDKIIAEGGVPQRRWGFPEDVGKVVAMLARGDLSYSTGQVIMVDGGMSIPRL